MNLRLGRSPFRDRAGVFIGPDSLLDADYEEGYPFPQAGRFLFGGTKVSIELFNRSTAARPISRNVLHPSSICPSRPQPRAIVAMRTAGETSRVAGKIRFLS
jgi:hypothetical protein